MSGEMPYVWASYAVTWAGMALYTVFIVRRIRRAQEELRHK
ncbi:MAG TPA: heme exporter protein CcmD [Longimicrobiales bacterium]